METTRVEPVDAEQEALPFSEADDEPITFSLTARARRAVAPDSLPSLEVVPATREPEHGFEDDPHDTRPARARALRRAGLSVQAVAAELQVDEVMARAWAGDVVGSTRGRRARVVALTPSTRPEPAANPRVTEAWATFEQRRKDARDEVCDLIAGDVGFARGLGLVSGLVELTPHAAIIATRDTQVGAAVSRWLTHHAGIEPTRLRVVLQVGPHVANDTAAYDWRTALRVPADRVTTTRWRTAPTQDAVQALIRVADPEFAGTLAGWRDALLATSAGPLAG